MWFLHKAVAWLLAGTLLGILLARNGIGEPGFYLSLSVLLVFLSTVLRKLVFVSILLLGVALGLMRSEPILDGHDDIKVLHSREVSVVAKVSSDPTYHESGQFDFYINDLQIEGQSIDGILRIRSFVNDIQRGDRVVVSGKMYDGFAFWQGSIYFAETEVLARDFSVLASFRARFISNIYSSVPDPEASLGLGFLIGIRALLPGELNEQLSITGLTHIIAVSGYNLTILVGVSRRLFAKFSRFQSLSFSVVFLLCFITVTGMSPSILRASIVSSVSLLAWFYGRPANAFLLLLYSSSVSALINPSYVWYDIGWYLSLFAFIGILVVAPIIKTKLYRDRQPKLISQILLETSSAQLMTMPIVTFVFGEFSAIALLANMLILPLIPFAMILTFFVGALYFVSWQFAAVIMWPCYLVLAFIVNCVSVLAQVDGALLEVSFTAPQMIAAYLGITAFVCFLYYRLKAASGDGRAKFDIL